MSHGMVKKSIKQTNTGLEHATEKQVDCIVIGYEKDIFERLSGSQERMG